MTKVHLTSEVVAAHEDPSHGHDHDDDHDHADEHGHEHHDHEHESGNWWSGLASALHLPGYGHTHERPALDAAYENELGIRAVRLAFILLAITTIIQIIIYLNSGSVALLADTVHNLGDALNSLPLWVAFVLLKRAPTRRYTYGFGRAEDLAGLVIVASIVFSAGYIIWETAQKLINPEPIALPGWVAAAAVVGFVGNEAVALIQIRAGKQIGSEAMIADGQHARVDGLTSLAVLAAVIGTWIGLPILDPLVGVLIGVVIIFIAREAAVAMWHRLMDAVDPALVEQAEQVLASHDEIKQVFRLRMRWVGHRLYANAIVALDKKVTLLQAEEIGDHIEHHLLHDIPHIYDVQISMVPAQAGEVVVGKESKHHRVDSH